jgi:hypothetical protein
MRKATWGQMGPKRGKIYILEKLLSPTAQTHYVDLEGTWGDEVTKVCVIVRCTKNVIEKTKAGVKFSPGWSFEG